MRSGHSPQNYYIGDQKKAFTPKGFFKGILKWIYNSIQGFVILFTLIIILYLFVLTPHIVDGISMQPNFCNGDIYFAEKIGPAFKGYQYNDVIAFKHDEANGYIKRVIGKSGDTIKVEGGRVYRNGDLLNEPYLPEGRITDLIPGDGLVEGQEYIVPTGQLFVMGDNRPNSSDSRHFLAIDPTVNTIKGKVLFVLWPLNRARIFNPLQLYPENECDAS